MDQRERIGNFEESVRAAVLGEIKNVWTALPGTVISFNAAQMTVKVQPTIMASLRPVQGDKYKWVQLPPLLDVPVVFPCAGGFAFTLPIAAGDEVLVIIATQCIDGWWSQGGNDGSGNPRVSTQPEIRFHDLSDGFAIPGPQSLPNALSAVSTTSCQMRKRDGSAYIELTAAGAVNIVAPGGVKVTGAAEITGALTVDAAVTASGEGTFNGGHTVSAHKHTGVQTGGGTTGPATG